MSVPLHPFSVPLSGPSLHERLFPGSSRLFPELDRQLIGESGADAVARSCPFAGLCPVRYGLRVLRARCRS